MSELRQNYTATVAICTHNRYDFLGKLIPQVCELPLSDGKFEVLIVDNSSDLAARESFYADQTFPENVRIVYSFPPGLSRARNVALEEARAPYVLYLDDDAEPAESWVQATVDAFRRHEDAAVVGGPILPLWTSPRPRWLPEKHEGCLTILNAGNLAKRMDKWEHAYGANMAFHVERAREAGGFSVALGRNSSRSLLSNEEVLLQDQLREKGFGVYYDPAVLVYHEAHPERVNQGWFRRRMAWQVVSNALSWDIKGDAHYYMSKAALAAARLGIDASFLKIVEEMHAGRQMDDQLELIIGLFEAMLLTDGTLGEAAAGDIRQAMALERRKVEAKESGRAAYEQQHRAPPALGARADGGLIFVEATPGHDYLFDVYARFPGAVGVTEEIDPWQSGEEGIDALLGLLDRSVQSAQRYRSNLVFMTVDYWARRQVVDRFANAIAQSGRDAYAFLHRMPNDIETVRYLSEAAQVLKKVIVFSPHIKEDLARRFNIRNVEYLPHHSSLHHYPSFDRMKLRQKLAIPEGRTVFGLIGEAREGKGLPLILDALGQLSDEARDKAFFIIAGKAKAEDRRQVLDAVASHGLEALVDLRGAMDRRQFVVLNEFEYSDYVNAVDIGLLIYQGPQRFAMSGVLPSYVAAGKVVAATADSYVGRLVNRYGLGPLMVEETGAELAATIERLTFAPMLEDTTLRAEFAAQIEEANVLRRLGEIVGGGQ